MIIEIMKELWSFNFGTLITLAIMVNIVIAAKTWFIWATIMCLQIIVEILKLRKTENDK